MINWEDQPEWAVILRVRDQRQEPFLRWFGRLILTLVLVYGAGLLLYVNTLGR